LLRFDFRVLIGFTPPWRRMICSVGAQNEMQIATPMAYDVIAFLTSAQ